MNYNLLAIDLDATLLNPQGEIEERDAQAIRQVREQGCRVVIATGRTWDGARRFYEELDLDTPVINTTGAQVFDPDRGSILYERLVPVAYARQVLTYCAAQGLFAGAGLTSGGSQTLHLIRAYDRLGFSADAINVDTGLHLHLERDPSQLVIWGSGAINKAEAAMDDVSREYPVQWLRLPNQEDPNIVHILHREASKGAALAFVASCLGTTLDRTVAVGDSFNDESMLSAAGLGIATGWAPQGVKDAADLSFSSSTVRPVAAAIKRFITSPDGDLLCKC